MTSLVSTLVSNGNMVYGLDLLDDNLFVVRRGKQHVSQYNSTSLNHIRDIFVSATLVDELNATDLAACSVKKCLYVSDYLQKCVHVVRIAEGQLVSSWNVDDNPRRLSVARSTNVVVVCACSGTIKEFSCAGTFIRELDISPRVDWPCHAISVENSGGQVLLCHGSSTSDQHGVSQAGADGRVVRSFSSKRGFMDTPQHMAIYRGDVLIADYHNSAVRRLNAELTRCGVVVAVQDGLNRLPLRLCVDEESNRLFVGSDNGTIQVFEMKTDSGTSTDMPDSENSVTVTTE